MTAKLTMKKLSDELQLLRTQLQELEARLESKIDHKLESAIAAAKPETRAGNTAASRTGIDTEQRQRLITTEAYLIAERRGFQQGDPAQDWAEAEKLVDLRLMQTNERGRPAKLGAKLAAKSAKKATTRPAKKPGISKKADVKSPASVKSKS